jgi:NADPH:quinone reductase-like Zn-dependent oxidoreductase
MLILRHFAERIHILLSGFNGCGDLELVDLPRPEVSNGRVLVRMTAAGVTPLDHTILSGNTPRRRRRWFWGTKERAS